MRSSALARLSRAVAPMLVGRPAPRVAARAAPAERAPVCDRRGGRDRVRRRRAGASRTPQWLTFVFLFVPSLPFFAMHVSETALLCSAYVLLATGIAVLFLDGPRARLGRGAARARHGPDARGRSLARGRSPGSWPSCSSAASLLGSSGAVSARGAALMFWGGWRAGALFFFLTIEDVYRNLLNHHDHLFTRLLPSGSAARVSGCSAAPLPVVVLVAGAGALEVALAAAARLGRRAARSVRRQRSRVGTALARGRGGGALARRLAAPVLSAAAARAGASAHAHRSGSRRCSPRWRRCSAWTSRTSCSRHRSGSASAGWTRCRAGFSRRCSWPSWHCALVLLLLRVAHDRAVRRFAWLLVLGAGGVVSLVLYSLLTQDLPLALGGRYLIGWYLCVLAVVGAGADARRSLGRGTPGCPVRARARAAILLVAGWRRSTSTACRSSSGATSDPRMTRGTPSAPAASRRRCSG